MHYELFILKITIVEAKTPKTTKIAISFFIKFIYSNLQKSLKRFYNFTIQRLYIIFAPCK